MLQHIGYIALLIRDYDEAISYFVEKLGFTVAEDTDLGGGKRWVLVAPPGSVEARLVLAKAVSADELARVGNQTGGRVFLFLHTDDFWSDYQAYRSSGVLFREEPREEQYGVVAVFEWKPLGPSGAEAIAPKPDVTASLYGLSFKRTAQRRPG
jgi:catechol 2,3-dioxygenase-like lactoylglutathione lyase family enzyme